MQENHRGVKMKSADDLFQEALTWLRQNYGTFRFFTERDVVWTLQTRLIKTIKEHNLSYLIFNDYPILHGERRSLSTDLVIRKDDVTEIAVEFKYEPNHKRTDILKQKFPVVSWGKEGIGKDIERILKFVAERQAKIAYSIFIDEGGYFKYRDPYPGSEWQTWNMEKQYGDNLSVLYARVPE